MEGLSRLCSDLRHQVPLLTLPPATNKYDLMWRLNAQFPTTHRDWAGWSSDGRALIGQVVMRRRGLERDAANQRKSNRNNSCLVNQSPSPEGVGTNQKPLSDLEEQWHHRWHHRWMIGIYCWSSNMSLNNNTFCWLWSLLLCNGSCDQSEELKWGGTNQIEETQ